MRKMNCKNQRGVVLIWVALLLLVLIGFVGLSIDMGLISFVANQLQVGADAAALAGAQYVRSDVAQARLAAMSVAQSNSAARKPINLSANESNAEGGDIVVGRYDRNTGTFVPGISYANAIQAVARLGGDGAANAPLTLAFGQLFGVTQVNIKRSAIAIVGGGTGAGMIALSPDARPALNLQGGATVSVNGGDIQVNSGMTNAVVIGGRVTLDAPNLDVVGDVDFKGNASDIGDTHINPDGTFMRDPLAYVPEPNVGSSPDLGQAQISTGSYTLSPGYYSGGFKFTGGTITLEPGVYILGGTGFDLSGGTNLTGDGVMFYIESGKVTINGTGSIKLSSPDVDQHSFPGVDVYEGLLFFQARDNDSNSTINGTSGLDLTGTLYFPKAQATLSGTSTKLGTQFIADKLEFSGTSDLTINYNGELAAPGNRIYLVR